MDGECGFLAFDFQGLLKGYGISKNIMCNLDFVIFCSLS